MKLVGTIASAIAPLAAAILFACSTGCSAPASSNAASKPLSTPLSRSVSQFGLRTGGSTGSGTGSGSFHAEVVGQQLPSLPANSGNYSVDVNGTAHALTSGESLETAVDDGSGTVYSVVALAADFATPGEALVIAVPQGALAVGSLNLDGQSGQAFLVDGQGNTLAYSTSGTLTITASSSTLGGFVDGSFTGDFAPAGCTTDADCASGQVCVSGSCASSTPPACRTDADCAAGQVCVAGACASSAPTACRTDADCAAGESCVSGACTGATPPPACRTDADCASGESCVNGACTVAPSGCTGRSGTGSVSGSAGAVNQCALADLSSLNISGSAYLGDGQDRQGNPTTILFIGDPSGSGAMFYAELHSCPAPGATLSAPADANLYVGLDVQSGDTELFALKTAASGTLSFSSSGTGLAVSIQASFGTDAVSGSATLQ